MNPGKPNFFRLSFRNCISCACNNPGFFFSADHLRLRIDCEAWYTGIRPLEVAAVQDDPTDFIREYIGNENIPSAGDVLKFIAFMSFQPVDPSKPKELNGYLQYLAEVRKVLIVDAQCQPGSLIITVEISSLQVLDELWEDYCTGHLNERAQKFLVTEDILKAFGLVEVKLRTAIVKEDYRDCREYLKRPGMENITFQCR